MPMEYVAWGALILGFILASLGTIIPGLPGTLFIVIGIITHKIILPETFSWWTVGVVVALSFTSWIVDLLSGVLGAKIGGATKFGLIGASVGGFFGIFFGLPGLIVGPFCGAVLGDMYAKRTELLQLLKSGGGASVGFVFSIIARLVILLVIAVIITIAAIV
jgi:uncharacterized protein YqgC (DUF456 family)